MRWVRDKEIRAEGTRQGVGVVCRHVHDAIFANSLCYFVAQQCHFSDNSIHRVRTAPARTGPSPDTPAPDLPLDGRSRVRATGARKLAHPGKDSTVEDM